MIAAVRARQPGVQDYAVAKVGEVAQPNALLPIATPNITNTAPVSRLPHAAAPGLAKLWDTLFAANA